MTGEAAPTILGIVLVACAAGFALLPLARGVEAVSPDSAINRSDRVAIYRQVLELELDHRLGKLNAEDYREQSAELLARAAELMRAERGSPGDLDAEIEREIAAARAALSAAHRGMAATGH